MGVAVRPRRPPCGFMRFTKKSYEKKKPKFGFTPRVEHFWDTQYINIKKLFALIKKILLQPQLDIIKYISRFVGPLFTYGVLGIKIRCVELISEGI